ncbi:hypothetical protein ABZ695_28850 [Streptomyces sp. NPDC006976]|uniref:hypothetical protein n=1 Tax=Streptomyces sp. NPDC006976 TaxID=3154311 RepID=UPI003410ABB6
MLKKNAAKSPRTYRNADQDAASLKATGKHIPDMHGRGEAVQRDLAAALTILKKGA